MNEKVRTFVAVLLPDVVKQCIAEFQEDLIRLRADVKWVKPVNVHITLKFLGDVDVQKIDEIFARVGEAVQPFVRFTIGIAGTGTFPNDRRPNVLWIAVWEGAEILIRMAERIDSALSPMGFQKDRRPFSPHLTIGRVRSTKRIEDTIAFMRKSEWNAGSFEAEAVAVMKSDLRPAGALYTPLATIKLQG